MTTNLDLAREVGKHVRLNSISLQRANIESKLDPSVLPPSIALVQGHRCSYDKRVDGDLEFIRVLAEFQFSAKLAGENEEPGEEVASLDAAFLLIYAVKLGLEIEERCFAHFADVNGPYNAWPYWRELVQTAMGRIGLSGITIPVFHPQSKTIEDNDPERGCAKPSSEPGHS